MCGLLAMVVRKGLNFESILCVSFANYVLASSEYVGLFEDICGSVLTPRKGLDSRECRGRDEPVHPALALRRAVLLNGYQE
jgi:hypothetical protein